MRGGLCGLICAWFSIGNVQVCEEETLPRERGREGERERGREGERETESIERERVSRERERESREREYQVREYQETETEKETRARTTCVEHQAVGVEQLFEFEKASSQQRGHADLFQGTCLKRVTRES